MREDDFAAHELVVLANPLADVLTTVDDEFQAERADSDAPWH